MILWPIRAASGLVIVTLAFYHQSDNFDKELIVNTIYGPVQGKYSYSRDGSQYIEYLGIPYAKSPTGELRFEPPKSPEKWTETKLTISHGSSCLQINYLLNTLIGSENCLFLNIFTPRIKGNELLPVIFYIHGGLFHFGNSKKYGASYFMDNSDVVLVTLNYRLGALGFLNTGDGTIGGNMGLKDQVMALKFVQENIHFFGGNSSLVTLMGGSAGAVSVHLHMLSNLSKGLFSRAILQSGNALNPWSIKPQPKKQSIRFAKKFNCSTDNTKEMAKCLKSLEANVIVQAHRESIDILSDPLSTFGPTLELPSKNDDQTFLTQMPIELIKQGKVSPIPWINGVNENEGLVFAGTLYKAYFLKDRIDYDGFLAPMIRNQTLKYELNKNWEKWIPQLINLENRPKDVQLEITSKLLKFYFESHNFQNRREDFIGMKNLANISNLLSDRLFFEGVHKSAQLYQNLNEKSPLYLYYYKYKGEFNVAKILFGLTRILPLSADLALTSGWRWVSRNVFGNEGKHYGSVHSDELALLFQLPFSPLISNNTRDYETSKTLVKTWIHFAKYGYPPKINAVEWTPIGNQDGDLDYMSIDTNWTLVKEPFSHRMKIWKEMN